MTDWGGYRIKISSLLEIKLIMDVFARTMRLFYKKCHNFAI